MSENVNDTPENEQLPEQPTDETQTDAKTPPPWVAKRFSELTAKRKEAEQREAQRIEEVRQLKEQLARSVPLTGAETGTYVPTAAEIDSIVQQRAQQLASQQTQQTAFQQNLERLDAEGQKKYGQTYTTAVQNLATAGVGGPDFLAILTEIPNSESVLTFLGQPDNLEEAIRISGLSPVKMGIALVEIAGKAGKALTKQVSKAPRPIEPLSGDNGGTTSGEPKTGTPEWFEWRNKNSRRNRR